MGGREGEGLPDLIQEHAGVYANLAAATLEMADGPLYPLGVIISSDIEQDHCKPR